MEYFELTNRLIDNWYYFSHFTSGRWTINNLLELPEDVNIDEWYKLAEEEKVVRWSQVHTAVEFFGPKNNKWLLNTIIDADSRKERLQLYKEVGHLIRSTGGNVPYISSSVVPVIHGNFFLYADPAYSHKTKDGANVYISPSTSQELTDALNISELSILTGMAHTGWLKQNKQTDHDIGEQKEILWSLLPWGDMSNVRPFILQCIHRYRTNGFLRQSMINMLTNLNARVEFIQIPFMTGMATKIISIPRSPPFTFVQKALLYHYSNAYEDNEELTIKEYYESTPHYIWCRMSKVKVSTGIIGTQLITNVDNAIDLYPILLDALLFHIPNPDFEKICIKTGLSRLVSLQDNAVQNKHLVEPSSDYISLIYNITLQLLYQGKSKVTSGISKRMIRPSEYDKIVKYGENTVGSSVLYTIAKYVLLAVINDKKVKNKESLLKFAEIVNNSPDDLPPTKLP